MSVEIPTCPECECERTLVLADDMSIACKKCGAVFDLEELPDLYEECDDDDDDGGDSAGPGDPRGDLVEDDVSAAIHARRGSRGRPE